MSPLILLLLQQAQHSRHIWEDADHVAPPAQFPVQPLQHGGGMDLPLKLRGKAM